MPRPASGKATPSAWLWSLIFRPGCAAAGTAARRSRGTVRPLKIVVLGWLAWRACVAVAAQREISFVELSLNGQRTGLVASAYRLEDTFLVPSADLRRLRLRVGRAAYVMLGEPYVDLRTLPGVTYEFFPDELRLDIRCQGDCLELTRIGEPAAPAPMVTQPEPGLFFNYDASYQRTEGVDASALFHEVGLFDGFGTITSTGLTRQRLTGSFETVRLETTWTYDLPQRRLRLRGGDAISRPGAWGVPVRFAGVQLGTDFSLQPYFITFPTPDFAGETAIPAVVDVYVNNLRRSSTDVPAGPFELQQVPVITGSGDIVLLIRDALGRQRTVTAPYYVSPKLLRDGLIDYTVEGGALRHNFAVRSDDYGDGFVSGTLRYGLTSALTAEGHAEFSRNLGVGGIGGVGVIPALGAFSASAAVSEHNGDAGYYWAAGFERQAPRWNVAISGEGSTTAFRRLGDDLLAEAPRAGAAARFGISARAAGYWGVGYVHREYREAERRFDAVLTSYSISLGPRTSLALFANASWRPTPDHTVGLTLAHSFGPWSTGLAGATRQNRASSALLDYQQRPPLKGGLGYRARVETGDFNRREAGLSWENSHFVADLDAADGAAGTAVRVGLRGGTVWFARDLYFSRPVEDSFAVVDVAGLPGVPVMQDNLVVGRTDENGRLFIRRLRPYQLNRVSIDPTNVPLTTQLGALEDGVVPRFRSGVHIRFDALKSPGVLIRVVYPDRSPVAAGTRAAIAGRLLELPVSVDGRLYLERPRAGTRITLATPRGPCTVQVPRASQQSELAAVEVVCKPGS